MNELIPLHNEFIFTMKYKFSVKSKIDNKIKGEHVWHSSSLFLNVTCAR